MSMHLTATTVALAASASNSDDSTVFVQGPRATQSSADERPDDSPDDTAPHDFTVLLAAVLAMPSPSVSASAVTETPSASALASGSSRTPGATTSTEGSDASPASYRATLSGPVDPPSVGQPAQLRLGDPASSAASTTPQSPGDPFAVPITQVGVAPSEQEALVAASAASGGPHGTSTILPGSASGVGASNPSAVRTPSISGRPSLATNAFDRPMMLRGETPTFVGAGTAATTTSAVNTALSNATATNATATTVNTAPSNATATNAAGAPVIAAVGFEAAPELGSATENAENAENAGTTSTTGAFDASPVGSERPIDPGTPNAGADGRLAQARAAFENSDIDAGREADPTMSSGRPQVADASSSPIDEQVPSLAMPAAVAQRVAAVSSPAATGVGDDDVVGETDDAPHNADGASGESFATAANGRSDPLGVGAPDAASIVSVGGSTRSFTSVSAVSAERAMPTDSAGVRPGEVAGHVVRAAQQVIGIDGTQHMRLEMHPGDLGAVAVELTIEGGTVHVDMTAERGETNELLRASLSELRASLVDAGFAAGRLDIQTDLTGNRFGQGDGRGSAPDRSFDQPGGRGEQSGFANAFDRQDSQGRQPQPGEAADGPRRVTVPIGAEPSVSGRRPSVFGASPAAGVIDRIDVQL